MWSITEYGGSNFGGSSLILDSNSNPYTLTIGDLGGSVTPGTYDLDLKVVDSANPSDIYPGDNNIKRITVTVDAADPCSSYTLTDLTIDSTVQTSITVNYSGSNSDILLNTVSIPPSSLQSLVVTPTY